ncbi:hypothetical protein A5893_14325 [Pedobacter psychrophilus]|uniref:Glycosyl transferase family 1 domain-containing protein n=1 Tax=Pedobacter psychrophilus TaxID=1826909 RepID=A0A179DC13_9SPHI|nr:glycosyltransferase [Pedobacter psychrophilus]OAQ38586.1 hypothetical protein A5893_14325 [Pedobacter psychrophilus]
MKILHITASYKPAYVYGGPVMSVAKLCEETFKAEGKKRKVKGFNSLKNGHQPEVGSPLFADKLGFDSAQSNERGVIVYTTLASGKEELPYKNGEVKLIEGVEVHYFKRITKDHSHLSPALLWHLWKTVKQFDIVHIHAWWNLVTMPACLIAIFRGSKVIFTPRGTLSNYSFQNNNNKIKAFFHQFIGSSLLNKTYFHCTSQKEVADNQSLLNPKAIFNIPNFVELPWRNVFSKEDHSQILHLIFLSRIEKKKGLEILFDALAKLEFEWKLSIVGNGELSYAESLRVKAKGLKIDDRIAFLGAVYGNEKFELMAQHDYLILPSYDENFANVVIESLFVGTPVLITKNVGLSEYVSQNNLGFVCERSESNIMEMIISANKAKNTDFFNQERLNQVIRNDFSEKNLKDLYLDMYDTVLKLS